MDLKTLFKLSYGLYIISSKNGDKINGQVANSLIQVSSKPPTLAVSLNKQNLTHELITKSKKFTVSVLSQDAPIEFIGKFGFNSGRDIDKFEGVNYKTDSNKVPIVVDNAIGFISCEVEDSMDVYTHTIFKAKITDAGLFNNDAPLTYADYHNIKKGKSPKTAPTYIEVKDDEAETSKKGKYKCSICSYIYDPEKGDEKKSPISFDDLHEDWKCPVCGQPKSVFEAL